MWYYDGFVGLTQKCIMHGKIEGSANNLRCSWIRIKRNAITY